MENSNAFYLGNDRAMISFGPLKKEQYCPFSCLFCYVSAGFNKYHNLTDEEILKFLKDNKNKYKIIYISGDTDSFAYPRTDRAINFLERLLDEINIDVLFTTRTVFNDQQLKKLEIINAKYNHQNKKLYACISIPRLNSSEYLESKNTPSPTQRIKCIKELSRCGIETILAMRPFLPIINVNEYKELIYNCRDYIKVVLGEGWYADDDMIKRVCSNYKVDEKLFKKRTMDFSNTKKRWKYYEPENIVKEISKYCETLHLKFFMRSKQAINFLKEMEK